MQLARPYGVRIRYSGSLLSVFCPPVHIVLYEHLILALIVLPILIRRRRLLRDISGSSWVALLGISWIGSAAATVLFTYALQSGNPTTAVLLQKLQPIFAILLARTLLNERWSSRFPSIALGGIAGAYLISFGNGSLLDPLAGVDGWPALLATLAALGWGGSTVLGRWLAPQIPFDLLTSLRVLLAVPLLVLLGFSQPFALPGRELVAPLVFMALVPGFAGLMLYYRGLGRTPAFAATVAELAFPATAALLNWVFLGAESTLMQVAGFVVVWSAIVFLRGQGAIDLAKPARP